VKRNSSFEENFLVEFEFEDFCSKCSKLSTYALDEICADCREVLGEEIPNWKTIEHILSNYKRPTKEESETMHHGYKERKEEVL